MGLAPAGTGPAAVAKAAKVTATKKESLEKIILVGTKVLLVVGLTGRFLVGILKDHPDLLYKRNNRAFTHALPEIHKNNIKMRTRIKDIWLVTRTLVLPLPSELRYPHMRKNDTWNISDDSPAGLLNRH